MLLLIELGRSLRRHGGRCAGSKGPGYGVTATCNTAFGFVDLAPPTPFVALPGTR